MSVLALLAAHGLAHAAADLSVSITQPSSAYVYQSRTWRVTVANVGNQTASGNSLVIQLPATNTSPSVYVMGTLGALPSGCSLSGTQVSCSIASLRRSKSTYVDLTLALPEAAQSLVVSATASTTSGESNTANNSASVTASLLNYAVSAFTGSATTVNRHCTGTGLTSFYECELFPSSLSEHTAVLHSDGTITFPDEPAYGGTWWQDNTTHLAFEYTYGTTVVAEFEGWGVSTNCWEGVTTFPDSTYVSPYEVCF